MKNTKELKLLRQEIAMLEAKIETVFIIVSDCTDLPDDEAEKVNNLWSESTVRVYRRLLAERGLPFVPEDDLS